MLDSLPARSSELQVEQMAKCPQCGKALKVMESVYEYDTNPASGLRIVTSRKKVGEKPAFNRYAPFCTLRCGWRWAKEHVVRRKRK